MRLWRRFADAARSPSRFVAFVVRVGQAIVRGELPGIVARLRAVGYTPDEYRAWRDAVPVPGGEAVPFVLLLDAVDTEGARRMREALGDFAGRARAVLLRAGEDRWREAGGTAAKSLAEWIAEHRVGWLWWIVRPVRFDPAADVAIGEACRRHSAQLVYADHEIVDGGGRRWPVFKSAFDLLQACERDLAGPWIAVHAELAARLRPPLSGGAGPWQLLAETGRASGEGIVHVPFMCAQEVDEHAVPAGVARSTLLPGVLQVAAAAGLRLDVAPNGTPWLRPSAGRCRVSIIVPTRDRADLLERCLRSVIAYRGAHDVDVVVVDNGSTERRVAAVLRAAAADVSLTVIRIDESFNFARLCNAGVAVATGRVVVLLNNDAEPCAGWLDELVGLATQPLVGAVGPLLVYPDGRVQSAGILVGVNRTATSALEGFAPDDRVARDWCATRRRVSAVLGACLAVERAKYLDAGGLDEQFAVSHNEVDFCLRLEAAGRVNAFTPYARVVHREGATRGFEVTTTERARLSAEETQFAQRWQAVLRACDPAYHPALARAGQAFALGPAAYALVPREGWRAPIAPVNGRAGAQRLVSLSADANRSVPGPVGPSRCSQPP